MKNNYTREYYPPHTNILSTFKTKTYNNYIRAIDEFVDNSIDAILRSKKRNSKNDKFKIILLKRHNDLIVMDNGDGAIGDEIKDVVILGSSGTKKSGTEAAHGTFGAGATSAALYLTNSEQSCNLTAVSFRGNQASLAEFDLETLEGDTQPWGYNFCHNPEESEDFEKKLTLLKSFLDKPTVSGTAIFIKNGANLFPSSVHDAWCRIAKSIQVNYAKRFKDFSKMNLEIEFEFYSDGSKGIRKSEKAGFNSWTGALDSLNYSLSPGLITWYFGGPDYQYERFDICGLNCGIRMSQFIDYSDRDKNDPWAFGYMRKAPQGISFIRNGKRIECSTNKAWIFDGWKRSILVEVEYEGDHHPHIKVNQEKTAVIVSEQFESALKNIIHSKVTTAQNAMNDKKSQKTLNDAKVDHLREGVAHTFASERKSKTDPNKVLNVTPQTSRTNSQEKSKKSYIGKTDNVKAVTSSIRRILPEFKVIEDYASRYTPFTKTLDYSDTVPKTIICVNKAHPFTNSLMENNCIEELFTMASSMLLGPSTHGKTNEEIFDEIEKFGEMYSEITKAAQAAKKKKLKIVP